MSAENNFDEIVRSKMEEQVFPFDESNWDLAESMIDEERKKEKRRRWFLIYFTGILTGASIMFLLMIDFTTEVFERLSKEKIEKFNDSHYIIVKNENRLEKHETESAASELYIEDGLTGPQTSQINNPQTGDHAGSVSGQKNNLIAQKQTDKPNNKNQIDVNLNYQKNNILNNRDTAVLVNKVDQIDSDKNDLTKKENSDSALALIERDSVIKETKLAVNDTLTESKDSVLSVVAADTMAQDLIDSSSVVHLTDEFELSVLIGILGGVVFTVGNNYNDTISGRGFSPSTGLYLEYKFRKKLSLTTGLYYHFSGKLNYHYNESASHHPGFGLKDSIITYTIRRLHYLNIPVQLNFNIGQLNQIGIGATMCYTGFSVSDIQKSILTNSGLTVVSENKGYNYLQGYKRFDAMLNISYRRKFTERWLWYSDANFGLLDMADNSYFSNSTNYFERNVFVRTGFIFKF